MVDLDRLGPLESEWQEIVESYRTDRYNSPTNRAEELDRVLVALAERQPYNPRFEYDPAPAYPVDRIHAFRRKLQPERSPLEALYDELACNELLAIQAVLGRDPGWITGASSLEHGLPGRSLLAAAWQILARAPESDPAGDPPKTLSAEQAAERLQEVIDRAGLAGWTATAFAPMSASMSVNGLDKLVRIRQGTWFSEHDVRRLAVHEVGVHVQRWENACLQPLRLFRSFPGYMATEEGLAVTSEARTGLLEDATLRKYAGRVVGINLGLAHPFDVVFKALVPHMDAEMAFDIATRVKRGFVDTAEPGAHTKDLVYLKGYLAVGSHLEEYPEDLPLLMSGKFGLQHLSLIREWLARGVMVPARYLPQDFHFVCPNC